MELFPSAQAPEESKRVVLTLQNVDVTGLTVFNPKDVQDIFAPYIGHSVTLDTVWLLAAQVTKRYHDAGYFLSRATIPQQKIENGTVHLHVIEGYIGDVKLQGSLADSRIVKQWIKRLKSYRPVTAAQIESVLLHLNDLPGVDLRAILEPMDTDASNEGSVRLALEQKPVQRISGSFNIDNYGSRFLGPYEGQVVVRAVTLPMQRTTLAGFSSLDWQEVKYGSLRHEVPLFAGATLEIYGSHTNAAPDHTLKPEDIRSNAYTLGASFDYSFIRQRQENLIGKVTLEGQNTESNILGAPLTRDYVRALRLSLNYQRADAWNGSNAFSSTLSQGLNFMGASQDGQRYISRAGAHPDFTKFNFDVSRLQALSDNWSLFGAGSSQVSS